MEKSFPAQRAIIDAGLPVKTILSEWPFLGEFPYFMRHFTQLMGFSLLDKFVKAVESKGQTIFSFMERKTTTRPRLSKIINDAKSLNAATNSCKGFSIGWLPLLLSYFGEAENRLISVVSVSLALLNFGICFIFSVCQFVAEWFHNL
jgi:hypothetical protein